MIDPSLLSIPPGLVDVTVPVEVDGMSFVSPDDPALPNYRVIANNRHPVALRDLMIKPVRTGYLGADAVEPDPALVPPTGAEAVPDVDVTDVYLPLGDGVARCGVYRPRSAPEGVLPVIVYLHGGGFTVGSSDDTDYLTRRLAVDNEALVVSANYRLAPENPFPVPLDDAFAIYRWVDENADRLGGDASRLVVAGDSSGSNLAAAIPLRARDEGARIPDAVVLLGAFVDFEADRTASFRELAPRGIVYDSAFFGFIRGAYLPTTDWRHPWASPAHGDLSAYPPCVVVAGTHDPIVDSARSFADALDAAGRTVTTYFPAGMPHGFYFFPGLFDEERAAYRIVADALAPVLHSTRHDAS